MSQAYTVEQHTMWMSFIHGLKLTVYKESERAYGWVYIRKILSLTQHTPESHSIYTLCVCAFKSIQSKCHDHSGSFSLNPQQSLPIKVPHAWINSKMAEKSCVCFSMWDVILRDKGDVIWISVSRCTRHMSECHETCQEHVRVTPQPTIYWNK